VEIWSLVGKQNVTCIDGILAFAEATGVDNVMLNTKITGFAKAKLEQGNRGMAIDDWRSIAALSPASRQRLRQAGIGLEIVHGSDFHFPDNPC
jgi:hypothetical protein